MTKQYNRYWLNHWNGKGWSSSIELTLADYQWAAIGYPVLHQAKRHIKPLLNDRQSFVLDHFGGYQNTIICTEMREKFTNLNKYLVPIIILKTGVEYLFENTSKWYIVREKRFYLFSLRNL